MKAVQIHDYGSSDNIAIVTDSANPTAKDGQVVVEVHAASLNRIDVAIREGNLKDNLPLELPAVLGGDFAGIVTEVGPGVERFTVGDEVYGQAGALLGGSGSLAELAAAQAIKVAKKPSSINMVESASLPLVGTSAIQGIEEHANIQKGQKILIHGGAGGIGSLAIQLAKLNGAYVATTVSSDDVEFVKALGADEIIDYKTQDFTSVLEGYDAVFVTAFPALNDSLKVLKPGGVLVSMVGPADEALAAAAGVKVIAQMTRVSSEQLTRLGELVDQVHIKPQVDKIFTMDQVQEALKYFETAHPRGKVVITIK